MLLFSIMFLGYGGKLVKNNKSGFTLTEILIVIVIIGIIISIAIPSVIAIRKRINERLFEAKKEQILIAAQLYGRDKNFTTDTIIYVYDLINEKYLKGEIEQNDSNCIGTNTSNGCILNPIDDSSLNNSKILIKRNDKSIIAIWDGELGSGEEEDLIGSVKDELQCGTITESEPCLYPGNNPNNYLYYSGVMWRIMGIYLIDGKEVLKIVTDDNVVWEISA